MSSRSGSSASSRSEPSRPSSTSPRVPRRTAETPRTKMTPTTNGTPKTGETGGRGGGRLEPAKKSSPGTARNPGGGGGGGGGVRSASRDGGAKTAKLAGEGVRQRDDTGEESRRKTSVVERKSSPLAQKRVSVAQCPSRKSGPGGQEVKPKSPTHSSTGRGASGGKQIRPSGASTDKTGAKSPNSTRKQISSGKPPSGAHSSSGGRAAVKQPTSGGTGAKTAAREKAGALSNGTAELDSRGEQTEKVRRLSGSSGGSATVKKTAVTGVKKSVVSGGRESPAGERKTSVEKKPTSSRSAGNSPATIRRAGSVRRPGGNSTSPSIARRSSTLRRVGSSGSLPASQRPVREKKAESVSPKIERRETKANSSCPKTEKKTGISSRTKPRADGEKKVVKSVSPGTVKKTSADPVRRGTAEKSVRGEARTGKQTTAGGSSAGINPLSGRRSVRSRSEVSLGTSGLKSLGRNISATSAVGRGSPSPSTLSGKSIILDQSDLRGEERVQSTLKLLGGKGGAGARKTGRGPVIKSMGVSGSTSGRSTPTGRNTSSTAKSAIARTGSGSSIPSRGSPKTSIDSRTRLRSTDDVLKSGRRSPAEAVEKARVTSPLSMTTVAPKQEKEVDKKETERESPEKAPEKAPETESPSGPTEAVKRVSAIRGMVARPSCRNTQVKSKIASWKKMEEEAKNHDSSSVSPVPQSPRSPHASFSPSSSIFSKPHANSDPPALAGAKSPPTSSLASLSPSHHSPSGGARQRSESPTVISSKSTPVKSRIAMWTEKEREARDIRSSLSPQRSPTHSPNTSPKSSPKGLRRQSPIDKQRRSPGRSAGNSREASVESNSLSNSREGSVDTSPSRQVPSITVREERGDLKKRVAEDDEVYEDVEISPRHRPLPPEPVEELATQAPTSLAEEAIYSTIPGDIQLGSHRHEGEEEAPELSLRPEVMKTLEGDLKVEDIEDEAESAISAGSTRLAPAYTEIDILEASESTCQTSVAELTPKSKRRWLHSPRFSRRKSSTDDHSEGATSDREEKKSEGFMKKITRFGSRSNKERQAVKRKSEEIPAKAYDSDSGASSSPEDTLTGSLDPRTRSTSEINSEQLGPEVIPRSNSLNPEVGYVLTSRKKLDPTSQRVVSSDPSLSENSPEYGTSAEKKLGPATQRVVSNPSLRQSGSSSSSSGGGAGGSDQLLAKPAPVDHYRKSAPPPQRGAKQRGSEGGTPLSNELRNIIDNLGEELEFCAGYSLPANVATDTTTSGSAPGGLRLPVRFDLNHGSSHPNLVSVGFQLPAGSSGSTLPNGVGGRGPAEGERGSDSSTASEGEERVSSEKEEEGDVVYPIESSLDSGRHTRYDIKRRVSESSDKVQAVDQNPENLVVTSLMYADAVWDRVGLESDELSFRVGDVIEILDMSDDTWWQGNVQEKCGWFPSTFVRLRIAQDEEDDDMYAVPPDAGRVVGGTLPRVSTMPAGESAYSTYSRSSGSRRRMTIRRKDSCPTMPRKLTPTEVRSKVVEEILNTERDYVKHLEDIIEGFLIKCRLNTKLFDQEKVETIFSNLEALYHFQLGFLRQLEARISPAHMEDSQIGEVFVICRDGFGVYSEYCNNHPHAVNEMCVLQKKEQYAFFFESCRLLRNLQNIPLEGFLLLPVQRICKYPLQLSELLKYTSEDHPDRAAVEAAVEAMRQVATHINEGKRRLENIGRIGRWQETIDNWKGPDIVETCTEMIHSSELHKISKGHSQERHFFLFDNQLIYCKKDAIGGRLSYKGRLSMDKCHVIDLPDGEEMHNGVPVKNAWKMDNQAKGKDYIIFAKSPEVKNKWMDAFQREKERVSQDRESEFSVSLKMKRAAAALCSTPAAVSAAKRKKSFNKKQVLRVNALSESVDSGVKARIEVSPAREKKGKFAIMKQIF